MKLFITIAFCTLATIAMPVDETNIAQDDVSYLMLVEFEKIKKKKNIDDALRDKRQNIDIGFFKF